MLNYINNPCPCTDPGWCPHYKCYLMPHHIRFKAMEGEIGRKYREALVRKGDGTCRPRSFSFDMPPILNADCQECGVYGGRQTLVPVSLSEVLSTWGTVKPGLCCSPGYPGDDLPAYDLTLRGGFILLSALSRDGKILALWSNEILEMSCKNAVPVYLDEFASACSGWSPSVTLFPG